MAVDIKGWEFLQVAIEDHVMVVHVARPHVMNALNGGTLDEIERLFAAFSDDDDLGAAVLSGAEGGKKPAFAAGADIAEMERMTGFELRAHSRLGQRALDRIERAGKPVIAAINGFALGGGLELAMACHMRFAAADGAVLGQPEINLGIIPGFAGTQRLPRLVGRGNALRLLLSGDPIRAAEALDLGLVDRVVPDADLAKQAFDLAAQLAKKAPLATALILDCVVRGQDMGFEDAQRLESDLFGVVGATEDVKEGLRAFLDRRTPEFKRR